MRFAGKTVLITGAAAGFGQAMAAAFAAGGANLVLGDLAAIPDAPDMVSLRGDVRDPAYADALVDLALDRFGGLDVAINNAGIVHQPTYLTDILPDEARKVIEVNLLGVLFCMQAQLRRMSAGAIVNMASVAGLSGAPRLGVYAASKHGVVGLTRSAALENARRGVRINAVCPAFARTQMAGDACTDPAIEAEMTRGVPMRRLASIDEVVQAALWLADPANSFVTGQCIGVDGGIGAM